MDDETILSDGSPHLDGETRTTELEVGDDQLIVIYEPPDTGYEIDAAGAFGLVADDAARRAEAGLRIVSLAVLPLRHGGTLIGLEGSGFETKAAIAAVYERRPAAD